MIHAQISANAQQLIDSGLNLRVRYLALGERGLQKRCEGQGE